MSKRDSVATGAGNASLNAPFDTLLDTSPAMALLTSPMKVVNVGLKGFADELAAQGVSVQHVEWQPPASGDPKLAGLLAKLGV